MWHTHLLEPIYTNLEMIPLLIFCPTKTKVSRIKPYSNAHGKVWLHRTRFWPIIPLTITFGTPCMCIHIFFGKYPNTNNWSSAPSLSASWPSTSFLPGIWLVTNNLGVLPGWTSSPILPLLSRYPSFKFAFPFPDITFDDSTWPAWVLRHILSQIISSGY